MKKTLATILVGGAMVVGYFFQQDVPVSEQPPVQVGATAEELLAQETPRFAEIDPATGEVLRVILIDQANLDTGKWGDPKNWVRTSDKGTIRKNHAGKGYIYDKSRDAFIAPKPRPDATLNEQTARWEISLPVEELTVATST
jgi:hypothetical protein